MKNIYLLFAKDWKKAKELGWRITKNCGKREKECDHDNKKCCYYKADKLNALPSACITDSTEVLSLFNFTNRINGQLDSFKKDGYSTIYDKECKSRWRIIVGLGSTSSMETSMIFHRTSGLPYIPSSSFKGLTRTVGLLIGAGGNVNKEYVKAIEGYELHLKDNKEKNEAQGKRISLNEEQLKIALLFGSQHFRGLLTFLDVYITGCNGGLFEQDIMNVHYPKYYSGNGPAVDYDNPNPIKFLTVKPGTKFRFVTLFDQQRSRLLSERIETDSHEKKLLDSWRSDDGLNKLRNNISEWIITALTEFGVGAKKNLGYGLFENPS